MQLSKSENTQYNRHLILDGVGLTGQLKLKATKVLVVGAGGLGCPILQYLSAAGIGTIGIIDDDKVEASNLQRQILYTHKDIGAYKAEVAASRLQGLNPHVKFNTYHTKLTTENAVELFLEYDIIVDGSDNFPTRYLCNDAAVITKKPLVFGSIYKFEGQVSVFNFEGGPTYRCLFPTPPPPNEVPNCSEIGVLGILPGIVGTLQGNEVLKIILGIGEVLSGKLLTYNTLDNKQFVLEFEKSKSSAITSLLADYGTFCGIVENDFELQYNSIKHQLDQYLVIDIRESWERADFNIGGVHISLYELIHHTDKLNSGKPILLYCESGSRSLTGKKLLADLLPQTEVFTLKGGIKSI